MLKKAKKNCKLNISKCTISFNLFGIFKIVNVCKKWLIICVIIIIIYFENVMVQEAEE